MLALSVGSNLSSAATIYPTHDVHHVTGTTTIERIEPPSPEFSGVLCLILDNCYPGLRFAGQDDTPAPSGSCNIAGMNHVFDRDKTCVLFVYDANDQLWYVNQSVRFAYS